MPRALGRPSFPASSLPLFQQAISTPSMGLELTNPVLRVTCSTDRAGLVTLQHLPVPSIGQDKKREHLSPRAGPLAQPPPSKNTQACNSVFCRSQTREEEHCGTQKSKAKSYFDEIHHNCVTQTAVALEFTGSQMAELTLGVSLENS